MTICRQTLPSTGRTLSDELQLTRQINVLKSLKPHKVSLFQVYNTVYVGITWKEWKRQGIFWIPLGKNIPLLCGVLPAQLSGAKLFKMRDEDEEIECNEGSK